MCKRVERAHAVAPWVVIVCVENPFPFATFVTLDTTLFLTFIKGETTNIVDGTFTSWTVMPTTFLAAM